mmetsp:Transcript_11228/g.18599  ORF Transcript_11228/g.18599 Transcript_11228/m.18599 type:complete len:539 (+) Transcript_11228:663-2279(+)
MDRRAPRKNEDSITDNKKKIDQAVMPSLQSGKTVSPMEDSGPDFRSMLTETPSVVGFARMGSTTSSHGARPGLSVEDLGLSRADLGFQADATRDASTVAKPAFVKNRDYSKERLPTLERQRLSHLGSMDTPREEPDYKPFFIQSSWENPKIRSIPKYYPLERSSRVLDDHEHKIDEILKNLSGCFRVLGLQAKYLENPAGAALLTPEQVEIYLYLWKTGKAGKQYCIEVQRRRGDSVTFHRYARHILEAASGDFDPAEYTDLTDSHYLKAAEKLLRNELAKAVEEREESLISIELAATLIKKDRFDARLLGMESLCILTDPRKTNLNTALLASRAVLFGVQKEEKGNQSFRQIHEFVLNVVQNRCMGDEDSFLQDMVVEYDSDDEDMFDDDDEERDEKKPPEYYDSMKTFVNYGLTILANSWEVVSTFESFESEPETTGASYSVDAAVAEFHRISSDLTHTDILTSLLTELGRADKKAHNACLAAKCLRILCQSSEEARDRTKSLYGTESASRAKEIGKATNARLERESAQLLLVLEA